jgi:hypothetical protein
MSWFRHNEDVSHDKVSIRLGRDWLVYQRGARKMSITIDYGGDQVNIFTDTVSRWDDDPNTLIEDIERQKILQDVSVDLEQRGLQVHLLT